MNSPKHVAIIMDGNGRWGVKNKNSRNLGHKSGLKTVETRLLKRYSYLAHLGYKLCIMYSTKMLQR